MESWKARHASRWASVIVCSTLVFLWASHGVGTAIAAEGRAPEIQISSHLENGSTDANRFSIHGLPQQVIEQLQQNELSTVEWKRIFPITVDQPSLAVAIEQPAMAGSYSVGKSAVTFHPRFPLSPGIAYRATFNPSALPQGQSRHLKSVSRIFRVPRPADVKPTTVSAIYPSADVLPENLLKFYVHFSAPMSGNQVHRHIQLINENTGPVELPFLELDDALWNVDMTQLTLFIDPGRIKREVKPLEDVGPSLIEGQSYRLVIDQNWLDANGNQLAAVHEKRFAVNAPDRSSPEIDTWQMSLPASGTLQPLKVLFGESLDQALAQRMIRVETKNGHEMSGTIALKDNETEWLFTPDKPWNPGEYVLAAQTTIEDLAGNNIGKLFEVDLRRETGLRPLPKFARRIFKVR